MPYLNLVKLLRVLQRIGIDPASVVVYIDPEAIEPKPTNPQQEHVQPDRYTSYDEEEEDDDEDGEDGEDGEEEDY